MDSDDVFKLLTGGGSAVHFDKKRHRKDIERFREAREEEELDYDDDDASLQNKKKKSRLSEEDDPEALRRFILRKQGKSSEHPTFIEEDGDEEDEDDNGVELFAGDNEEEEEGTTKKGKDGMQTMRNKKKKEGKEAALMRAMQVAPEYASKRAEIASLYRKSGIRVSGTEVMPPLHAFSEVVGPRVVRNLAAMGIRDPTPIQQGAVPAMLQERDVLGIAPTGSGKTLAYLLPILHKLSAVHSKSSSGKEKEAEEELAAEGKRAYRAIVVSPTRELAQQIHRILENISAGERLRVSLLTKGVTEASAPKSRHIYDFLIATPLRLVHMIHDSSIDTTKVQSLVFDEADRLFDSQFVSQIDEIADACLHPSNTSTTTTTTKNKTSEGKTDNINLQIALFSATMAPEVEQLATSVLRDPIRVLVGRKNTASGTIEQHLVFAGSEDGKLVALHNMLTAGTLPLPALVFVQSPARALQLQQALASFLRAQGKLAQVSTLSGTSITNVAALHAGLGAPERLAVVDAFRAGRVWLLVATELAARGLDFRGAAAVVNYDLPPSAAAYVHRVGRTGRAGRHGAAWTFYTEEDAPALRAIAPALRSSGVEVPEWISQGKKLSQKQKQRMRTHAPKRFDIGVRAPVEAHRSARKLVVEKLPRKHAGSTHKTNSHKKPVQKGKEE